MYGLARALRRAAAVGRLWAPRRGGGGAGARPWGWGLALGLALGVKVPTPAGCEADGGQEAEANSLPPPRGFSAAIERSRDLLRRIKVLSERGWRGAGALTLRLLRCEPALASVRGEVVSSLVPADFAIAARDFGQASGCGTGGHVFRGLARRAERAGL